MADFGMWLRGLLGKREPVPDSSPPHVHTRPSGPQSFAEDCNDFTFAVYRQLRQQPGNLFFSPFSIRTVLSMVYAGARDETAAQMREALCISSTDETLHVASAETVQQLSTAGGGDYEMAVTNSFWGQEGEPFQPDFLDLITRHYRGAMNLIDFRRDAEAARVRVNQWVEDKTRQKIRELIPSGGVDANARLVLVNAVYFKGTWNLPFRRANTRDKPFHLEDGGKVQAPLMYQQELVRYLQARSFQAVELVYRGDDLSMLVLLPSRNHGLRDLEKMISARMLHDLVAQMQTSEVELFLPRFKITWGAVNVVDHLAALGMPLAFTRFQANFSGINGRKPPHEESLFVSAVFHKAFVETNEEGTEAAAATALTALLTGSAGRRSTVSIFRADHPFLFAIRDLKSGAILFLGRMSDPTRET